VVVKGKHTNPPIRIFADEEDRPANTFSKDDFPAPLGPIMAQTFPEGTYQTQKDL
jgi:hypothetical protein